MSSPDSGPAEIEITEALWAGRAEDWDALRAAAHVLAEEIVFAAWAGGEVVGTTTVDGEERPVNQMPYAVYSEPVRNVLECLGALGLFVAFDWVHWEGLLRYRDNPSELETAPVSDAVRILVAVQRSERFVDGSIEGALESGLIQTALARIIDWFTEERLASD
ncbi:MAG TPA: DUF6508 domain-containing protein [Acidimicrobiia bacterium]